MNEKLFLTADDVAQIMSISKPMGYKIISELNKELSEKGYLTIHGRVSKKYFEEKLYGYSK